MKRQNIRELLSILFTFSIILTSSFGQEIDHWETIVYASDEWQYILPSSEPDENWRTKEFDASSWRTGIGGIGYGDGDDGTSITNTTVCYMRRGFLIEDINRIQEAIFNMDYDDGYIAYLNGHEIGRSNLEPANQIPTFDQTASDLHEAQMYQGGEPLYITLDQQQIREYFNLGENILAIQVYNDNIGSSDLSSIPFLSIGVNDPQQVYGNPPMWFNPPTRPDGSFSSNLPIVVIETNGLPILDEPRINAQMGIIYDESKDENSLSDGFNHFEGQIAIEIRGSSSQSFPKKQYRLELQNEDGSNRNEALLGMPTENDWILYAPYSDKSLIRNILVYKLARDMGYYAPRTKLCELILNGEYMGVYVLMEKIKRDKNRVDINKLNPDEIEGEDLTGGYIVKVDRAGGDKSWFSPFRPIPNGQQQTEFVYEYPKSDDIMPEQEAYIRDYITSFEDALIGPDFNNPTLGYQQFIDIPSFVDFVILNEISRNVDAYRLSTYMYKDKNEKLKMGPIWDFNLAFGNADYCEGGSPQGWQYLRFNEICANDFWINPFWWRRLMTDSLFCTTFQQRWDESSRATLSVWRINEIVDSLALDLSEAQRRNFERWPVLGRYVWPNNYVGNSFEEEISWLKEWVRQRIVWMNGNVPSICEGISINPTGPTPVHPEDELIVTPNPFQEELTIEYSLYGVRQSVVIDVYDIQGRKIANLVDAVQIRGNYELTWDGSNMQQKPASAGIYLFVMRLRDNEVKQIKKVLKY